MKKFLISLIMIGPTILAMDAKQDLLSLKEEAPSIHSKTQLTFRQWLDLAFLRIELIKLLHNGEDQEKKFDKNYQPDRIPLMYQPPIELVYKEKNKL